MIARNSQRTIARLNSLIATWLQWFARHTSVCVSCGFAASEYSLCIDCVQSFARVKKMTRLPYLPNVFAGYYFQFPVSNLLRQYKYHQKQQLATALQYAFVDALRYQLVVSDVDLIVPVPLHFQKLRKRGFNQSFELAYALGRALGIAVSDEVVIRRHPAVPQVDCTTKRARFLNVKDAFCTVAPLPASVLLVDDVITTGATISEVARVMVRGGVKRVQAASLCISERLVQ